MGSSAAASPKVGDYVTEAVRPSTSTLQGAIQMLSNSFPYIAARMGKEHAAVFLNTITTLVKRGAIDGTKFRRSFSASQGTARHKWLPLCYDVHVKSRLTDASGAIGACFRFC